MTPEQKRAHDRMMLQLPNRTVRPLGGASAPSEQRQALRQPKRGKVVVFRQHPNVAHAARAYGVQETTIREWVTQGKAQWVDDE